MFEHRPGSTSTCCFSIATRLHNKVILKGLAREKEPMVPRVTTTERKFFQQWHRTHEKATYSLLKHLKNYHRDAIEILDKEIDELTVHLKDQQDFEDPLARIIHKKKLNKGEEL